MAQNSSQHKPLNRNRLSLILQLASPTKPAEDISVITKSKPSTSTDSKGAMSPVGGQTPTSTSPLHSPTSSAHSSLRSPFFLLDANKSQPNVTLPSTINELDSKEKKALLKKARKLSRVFGEVPISQPNATEQGGVEMAQDGFDPKDRPTSPFSLSRSGSTSKRRKIIRRLSNADPSKGFSAGSSSWIHSSAAPRPILPVPASIMIPSNPNFSEGASSVTGSPVAASVLTRDTDDHSIASIVPDPEQQRRIRLAKLSRHLGENIPPALVGYHVDEEYAGPTPSFQDAGSSLHETDSSVRRLTRDKTKSQRRMSYDMSTLVHPRSPASGSFSFLQKDPTRKLKRSRSLWTTRRSQDDAASTTPQPDWQNLASDNQPSAPFSERQKTLNVKRARKMAQMFGSEPPPALFQVNTSGDSRWLTEGHRGSLATLVSVSESPVLDTNFEARGRSGSIVSSISTNKEVGPLFDVNMETTPPPYSGFVQPQNLGRSESSHIPSERYMEGSGDFHARRRRAAKLSRFFGVAYQDLSQVTRVGEGLRRPGARSISEPPAAHVNPFSDCGVELDVKMSEPARFWGFKEGRRRNADMADVIGRLREMKAAT